MTKVSVFGQETEKKKGKPIEFIKCVNEDGNLTNMLRPPNEFKEVLLLEKNYTNYKLDAILAFDNQTGVTFVLGHWNDGFVE